MLDTSNCPYFQVTRLKKVDNGIGGFVETPIDLFVIQGYLDMLSGNEGTTFNAFLNESTHVLLTDYRDDLNTKCVLKDDKGNTFNITFIDDPVGLNDHLEVYLKHVGDGNV